MRVALSMLLISASVFSQELFVRRGEPVPAEVEKMYVRGLKYLASAVTAGGAGARRSGEFGPGVIGLAVLAMLARGDDPNVGPYSVAVHKGIKDILEAADKRTGYIGPSMYHHGFATLALAEAYGSVKQPGIGVALQKAVDLIVASQKRNPYGGWRYAPESTDADTTVAGAQMVALFAARNAGVAVPEECIRRGLQFYRSCQDISGGIGYTTPTPPNVTRTAIGALVFSLAGQKESAPYKAMAAYLKSNNWRDPSQMATYYLEYYASQAAFHMDEKTWEQWNAENIKRLSVSQAPDGSWSGTQGPLFSTSAALLSLALNYRYLPIYER
ncbi:MAG: terpene cyclase/mutase family protein [Verrucomicrobiae bacterium]|nr:terpene cyclase/mutase family protein [Verrucomicrobiae bacterium]